MSSVAALMLTAAGCGGSSSSTPTAAPATATAGSATATGSSPPGADTVVSLRLQINRAFFPLFGACANPLGSGSTLQVVRSNNPTACQAAVDTLRSHAQHFLDVLPSLQASDATRSGLTEGLNALIARLVPYQTAAFTGSDQAVVAATDSIGNALDQIRQAGN